MHAFSLSLLLSFRAHSETLQLRRAYNTDVTEGFTPQLEMTLIAARTTDEQQILLVKLMTRKNLASGCILRRPCFLPIGCSEGENAVSGPRHLGGGPPSGGPWTATVSADHPTPVNRAPKAVLVRPGVPSADHYSSHGFRRGTSQELQETGSPGSAVATSEIWPPRFPGRPGHVDGRGPGRISAVCGRFRLGFPLARGQPIHRVCLLFRKPLTGWLNRLSMGIGFPLSFCSS